MADNKEPQKGQQQQAPTQAPAAKQQQAPAAPTKETAAPTPTPAPAETTKPTAAPATRPKAAPTQAPKAQTPVAPAILLRSDAALLESGQFRSLLDRRRKLYERRSEALSKLTLIDLDIEETNERIRFLLTPSPIFDANAVPNSHVLSTEMSETRAMLGQLVGSVGTLSQLVSGAGPEALVERILGGVEHRIGDVLAERAAPALAPAHVTEDEEAAPAEEAPEEDEDFLDFEAEGQPEVVEEIPDHDWMDAATAPELAVMPDVLPLELLTLDGVGDLTIVSCTEAMSGHISAFGAEVARQDGVSKACVYVRYKQAPKVQGNPWRISEMYRYSVLDVVVYEGLVEQAVMVVQETEGASIGSYVEKQIKPLHDKGLVVCQKLDRGTGQWVTVPTRAERQAAKTTTPAPAQASRPSVPARQSRPGAPMASVGELVRQKMGDRGGVARKPDALGDAFLTD